MVYLWMLNESTFLNKEKVLDGVGDPLYGARNFAVSLDDTYTM